MTRFRLTLCALLAAAGAQAQLPEDALRLSNTFSSGTARQQAIGGAMASLGGDLSAISVNPAGLGFYKTSEVVLTPGFGLGNTKGTYLGDATTGPSSNHFFPGTSGLVIGNPTSPEKSTAFAIAISRTADFYGHTFYQGKNGYSSGAEAYAEEYSRSGENIDAAVNDPGLSYGTRMALYTYLVDTATIGGSSQVIAQPQNVIAANGLLLQANDVRTTGGITELALGFASSQREKWYLGASLGIPIVNYHQYTRYTETDASGNTNNDFGSYTYTENYASKGVGVNIKLGAIYRPGVAWRFGLALHTPTLYTLNDKVTAGMSTNTENYTSTPTSTVTSDIFDAASGGSNRLKYDLTSPWHFLASASYVFGAGTDQPARQGFITGDAEYVTNKSSRFSVPTDYEEDYTTDNGYYDALNSTVKSIYKNNFRFRLGGEIKFNTLAVRVGGSYATTPYASTDVKYNHATLGGGIGYRNKGLFADLTYVEAFTKDGSFPYRLADKDNLYAVTQQQAGAILLTVGFKF